MEFERSSDEHIEHYWEEVKILISEMDYDWREIYVTDCSILGDFFYFVDRDEYEKKAWTKIKNNLYKRYGIKADLEDRVWVVAEKIRYGQ